MKLPIWLIVFPFLLFSSLLAGTQLNEDSLTNAERNTVKHLVADGKHLNLGETIASLRASSTAYVPAWYLQLALWSDIMGLHFFVLRAFSWLYYVISLALMYGFSRQLFDKWHALYATGFVALSGMYLFYGHEIRMYSAVVTLTILLMWTYWRVALSSKQARWFHYVLLWLVSVVSLFTHNLLFLVLFGIAACHLLLAPRGRAWFRVALVEVLAGLAFLPWLSQLIGASQQYPGGDLIMPDFWEALFNGVYVYSNGLWIAGALLLLLFIWKFPRRNFNMRFVLLVFATTVLMLLLLNGVYANFPPRRMRYSLIWLPSLAILFGYGAVQLHRIRKWGGLGVVLIWFGMLAWFLQSDEYYFFTNQKRQRFRERLPFHQIGNWLETKHDPYPETGEAIFFFDSEFSYSDYLLDYYREIYDLDFVWLSPSRSKELIRIRDQTDVHPGFWFAFRPANEAEMAAWLSYKKVAAVFEKFRACIRALDTPEISVAYYLPINFPCELIQFLMETRSLMRTVIVCATPS